MIKFAKNRWYKKTEAHGWARISSATALAIDLNEVGKIIDGGGEMIFILWS